MMAGETGVDPVTFALISLEAVAEAIAVLSFEEYCGAEGRGDRRHELVGARVFAVAGGSERHDLLAGLLYEALAGAVRTAGCRPFLANPAWLVPSSDLRDDNAVAIEGRRSWVGDARVHPSHASEQRVGWDERLAPGLVRRCG